MATQNIPHTAPTYNLETLLAARRRLASMTAGEMRQEALRTASERLNGLSPVQMLNADIRVDVSGMYDPGPDYTPTAWR